MSRHPEKISQNMEKLIHESSLKWLHWILSNPNVDFYKDAEEKPFPRYYCELRQTIGLFPENEKLPEEERDKLFSNVDDWHNVAIFTQIINSVTDYKLLAFIILYKMRTTRNKVLTPENREFFIVGFERLITLTESAAFQDEQEMPKFDTDSF